MIVGATVLHVSFGSCSIYVESLVYKPCGGHLDGTLDGSHYALSAPQNGRTINQILL